VERGESLKQSTAMPKTLVNAVLEPKNRVVLTSQHVAPTRRKGNREGLVEAEWKLFRNSELD